MKENPQNYRESSVDIRRCGYTTAASLYPFNGSASTQMAQRPVKQQRPALTQMI